MRLAPLTVLLFLCLALTACGEKEPGPTSHGLESKDLASTPQGDAITLRYDLQHRASYKAVLSVTTEVFKKGVEGGRSKDQTRKLRATQEHTWRIDRPTPNAPMTSAIELRYVEAEGESAEAVLAREVITGRLAHDAKGKAEPASLRLAGGTKPEQIETLDLVGSLLLAGYGGSPSWVPPRAVREGEAWPLAPFLRLRAVSNIRARVRELGVVAPDPRFTGTARLRRVRKDGDRTLLELELEALIEMQGEIRKNDGRRGSMSIGNRYQGLATIDAQTGVPTSFDVTHTYRQHVTSANDDITVGGTVTVRGTVTRQ